MRTLLGTMILLIFGGSYLAKVYLAEAVSVAAPVDVAPRRIVSLAPSITETLFALGLGDRVVGVSRFCDYPPEALGKPRVGGYFHPNFEAIVALNPDLVVSTGEGVQPSFDKLGLPVLIVNHKSIDGIYESILTAGRVCGKEAAAREVLDEIDVRLEDVRREVSGRRRPKVLCVVQRTPGTASIEDACIAGCDGHLDHIIALAGGQNAYNHGTVRFPVVSAEGLMAMNPEVIIDFSPAVVQSDMDRRAMTADWQQLGELDAVRNGRVHLLADDYATVPGPRFILVVEKLARLIHPEADWPRGPERHSLAGGNPERRGEAIDSRLRGNDGPCGNDGLSPNPPVAAGGMRGKG